MAENSTGETILAFMLGAIAGAAAGVLLAPEPGRKTRRRLADWLEELKEEGEDFLEEQKDVLAKTIETTKESLADELETKKRAVEAALKAGKKAYRETGQG